MSYEDKGSVDENEKHQVNLSNNVQARFVRVAKIKFMMFIVRYLLH